MAGSLDIEEVLSKNDIVDIVSEYVPLKKKGANYVGLCPFHNDRNPSFMVSDTKQIFKCFSCGVGGNAIKFISLAEKLDFKDALYFLADKAGIDYQKNMSSDYEAKNKLKQDILSLNKATARFFHDSLNKSQKAIKYVNERKIAPEMVRRFGLGYSPDSWEALVNHFTSQGISHELLLKAGLISSSNKNGAVRYYDRFVDRLMFPIFDDIGNVIGFGGRLMEKNDKMAKYINSAETPAYYKGNNLYGLNFAKKSSSKRVIIVEGYMDCIALHQKGIDFAVASLGTALTKQQAKLIKKYFTEVVIAFDADDAGRNATLRGMDILKEAGLRVKVFRLSGAKDADEYLRTHTQADFLAQLEHAMPLTEYKISLLAEDYPPTGNENKVEFIKKVNQVLGAGEVEREVYADWLVKKYGSAYGLDVRMFLKRNQDSDQLKNDSDGEERRRRIILGKKEETYNKSESEKKIDVLEKSLLLILSEDPVCIKKLGPELSPDIMTFPVNREMLEKLLELHKKGNSLGKSVLMNGGSEDSVFAEILMSFIIPEDGFSAAQEIVHKLKKKKTEKRINELNELLCEPGLNNETRKKLLDELKELSRRKDK